MKVVVLRAAAMKRVPAMFAFIRKDRFEFHRAACIERDVLRRIIPGFR